MFKIIDAVVVIILLFFSSMMFPAFAQTSPSNNQDSIAILIGNKDYDETKNVDYAIRDVQSMKAFLIQKLGYDKNNIFILKNATLGKMRAWFGREGHVKRSKLWHRVTARQSNVFVYYSGHGAPAQAGQFSNPYLIPTDIDPEFAADGYSLKQMQYSLETIQEKVGSNKHVILMLDACFSGNSAAGTIVKNSSGITLRMPKAKIIRLNASSASQVANWDNQAKHGLFTSQFLQAVEGKADTGRFGNQDGKVSWSEMSKFLKYRVSYLSKNGRGRREQNPELPDSIALNWDIAVGEILGNRAKKNETPKKVLTDNAEKEEFDIAQKIGSEGAWKAFLYKYSDGRYAPYAQSALDKLETDQNNRKLEQQRQLNKELEMQARLQKLQDRLDAEERRRKSQQAQYEKERKIEIRRKNSQRKSKKQKSRKSEYHTSYNYTPPSPQRQYNRTTTVTPSFNCQRAKKTTEKAICQSSQLAVLDNKLVSIFNNTKSRLSSEGGKQLWNIERLWIKKRNECYDDPSCIARSYQQQIQVLRTISENASPSFNCKYAKKPTEKAICYSTVLAELDHKLVRAYNRRVQRKAGQISAKKLHRWQQAWLSRRNKCSYDITCIAKSYVKRIQSLNSD